MSFLLARGIHWGYITTRQVITAFQAWVLLSPQVFQEPKVGLALCCHQESDTETEISLSRTLVPMSLSQQSDTSCRLMQLNIGDYYILDHTTGGCHSNDRASYIQREWNHLIVCSRCKECIGNMVTLPCSNCCIFSTWSSHSERVGDNQVNETS